MENKNLKFVCKLEQILAGRNITPTELFKDAGISLNTIYKLTGGGRIERIDRSTTEKIMQHFECEFNDVWDITVT